MFCDGVANLDAAERARYADLLVLIAAADGELVREEIQVLEGFMGRAMVHPEARTSIRKGLYDTNRLSNLLKNAELETLRYALRDGALLAAADGEYDRRELRILKKIASTADVDEKELKSRKLEVPDRKNYGNGVELFQHMRNIISPSEEGASILNLYG